VDNQRRVAAHPLERHARAQRLHDLQVSPQVAIVNRRLHGTSDSIKGL
jgi:hypothetical protein